jgi:glycosyltransferase involved in cell wall biosynthesis
VAEKLVDIIFTSSQESFRLVSSKVNFMGHGINLEEFKVENQKNIIDNIFNIIYVGRVSLIKNQKLLIEAVNILVNQYNIKNIKINLIGGASNSKDEDYIAELKRLIEKYKLSNFINFLGSVPHREIRRYYEKADLSINLCPTGGMDKTVLESMAASLPVVVYNKAFASTLKDFANLLVLNQTDAAELAEKIKKIIVLEKSERVNLNNYLLKSVEKFSIVNLIKTITDKYIRENKNIT